MTNQPSDVVVALSGGLDSSLAAALLKSGGWKVYGLHFLIPTSPSETEKRINAVHKIADHLQIPLKILDLKETFNQLVIDPFVHSYLKGLTPNPCIMCNQLIKFEYLFQYAEQNGIHCLATGHYVRVRTKDGSTYVDLLRGKDKRKEQSYFLHRLSQPCLSRSVFPLGDMDKDKVRRKAGEMELPVDLVSESQEICFIPEKNYRLFIENRKGVKVNKRGNIINNHGEILGEHTGTYRYTIGQRQGLGIASSRPYYVKKIRPETNEVVVGRKEELFLKRVEADSFEWIGDPPSQKVIEAQAQVRYRHIPAPGRLEVISSDKVRFIFDAPQLAITPGQALVCYQGDQVLGGGWILQK